MSVSGSVSRRYARALKEIGLEKKRLRPILIEFERVADTISSSVDLQNVMRNPMILTSQRKKVVDALVKRLGSSKEVRNACMLLVDKGRGDIIPDIARELKRMVDDEEGVLSAEIVSAATLNRIYLDKLSQALKKATGKKVELTTKQDESLIGGVVTRVGGVVYDGSLKARLARVREQMLR